MLRKSAAAIMAPIYIGKVMPVFVSNQEKMVPSPMAKMSWKTAAAYMLVCRSCFFSSSTNNVSSSGMAVSNKPRFSINRLPSGPPTKLPEINPNVAAAVQIVVAPLMLKSSKTGPKAPAVPWPPTIGMEPVHIPTRGLKPSSLAIPTASRFWDTIKAMTRNKNRINDFPPLRSTLRFAWNPTEVKKNTMHTSRKISSNENSATPVV